MTESVDRNLLYRIFVSDADCRRYGPLLTAFNSLVVFALYGVLVVLPAALIIGATKPPWPFSAGAAAEPDPCVEKQGFWGPSCKPSDLCAFADGVFADALWKYQDGTGYGFHGRDG